MDFSYIDLVILIPLLYGMYKGFTKGLILSLATLLGLFLGIYGGVKFSHITAQFLLRYFEIDVPLIAFSVTFLMLLVGVYLLGKILSKFIDVLALGFFNKVAGALFGVSKVVLILLVLLLFGRRRCDNADKGRGRALGIPPPLFALMDADNFSAAASPASRYAGINASLNLLSHTNTLLIAPIISKSISLGVLSAAPRPRGRGEHDDAHGNRVKSKNLPSV